MKYKIITLQEGWIRPICPECGKHTIVLFSPPKEPADFSKLGTSEYVDLDRTHIYCCNGSTDCKINTPIKNLTTPLTQPK